MADELETRAEGRHILVVEDDYLIAEDLSRQLEGLGAVVLGPVPNVSAALDLMSSGQRIDGATLDVKLGRDRVYPVAEALRDRGVPFVFMTGYDHGVIPEEFRKVPRFTKPVYVRQVLGAILE